MIRASIFVSLFLAGAVHAAPTGPLKTALAALPAKAGPSHGLDALPDGHHHLLLHTVGPRQKGIILHKSGSAISLLKHNESIPVREDGSFESDPTLSRGHMWSASHLRGKVRLAGGRVRLDAMEVNRSWDQTAHGGGRLEHESLAPWTSEAHGQPDGIHMVPLELQGVRTMAIGSIREKGQALPLKAALGAAPDGKMYVWIGDHRSGWGDLIMPVAADGTFTSSQGNFLQVAGRVTAKAVDLTVAYNGGRDTISATIPKSP